MTDPIALPAGCSLDRLSTAEAAAHEDLVRELRRLVRRVESTPGRVVVTFALRADDDRLIRLVATERRCCSFLEVGLGASTEGATVTFRSDTPAHGAALSTIARGFDAVGLPPPDRVGRAGLAVGAVGVACGAACALPPLIAAGGIGVAGGLAGGGWLIGGAVAAVGVAVAWALSRRRRSPSSCGCSTEG